MHTLLSRLLIVLGLALPLAAALANEGGYPWDRFPADTMTDVASLQNGARIFTNYCLGCHSASYMRFNRLHDIDLTDDQIKKNLLFATDKVGDTMRSTIDPRQAKDWFGTAPPDLSVIARSRGEAGDRAAASPSAFQDKFDLEFSTMMVLYSGTTDPYSHRCRFVLFEKGMDFEIRDVDLFSKPEDIALMNPYNEVPILVERDLILYESHIINEYIDERFPHPQLMPGDPVARARVRLFLFNFEKELFAHVNVLEGRGVKGTDKQLEKARSQIRDRLTQLAPIFLKNKYMLGDDFSMLDVAIAPLLWRLDYYGIDMSKNAVPLLKYAERIFSRPAYIEALTPSQKVMRK